MGNKKHKRTRQDDDNENDKSLVKRKKSAHSQAEKEAEKFDKAGNYEAALEKYTEILESEDLDEEELIKLKVKKAMCLVNLQRFTEAISYASSILEDSPDGIDCLNLLGNCYYQLDIEKSIFYYEKSLSINPAQKKITHYEKAKKFVEMKKEANGLYISGNYADAYKKYQLTKEIDPSNKSMKAVLLFNMAQASYKLKSYERCLLELNESLSLKPDYIKALLRRAQCYLDKRKYEQALDDLQKATEYDKTGEAKEKIADMMREAQRNIENIENDPFGILGLSGRNSWDEINKAYRKLIKENHPDRHSNSSEEEKQFRVARSKEITRAYRTLKEKFANNSQGTHCNWQNYSQRPNQSQYQHNHRHHQSQPPGPNWNRGWYQYYNQNQYQNWQNNQNPNTNSQYNQNWNKNSSQSSQNQHNQYWNKNPKKSTPYKPPQAHQTQAGNNIFFVKLSRKPAFTNYVPPGQSTFRRCTVCSVMSISKNDLCAKCNAKKSTAA